MRAIVIRQPGGPEVLELRSVADPVPGPDDVRVRVRACGVNRADLLQRRGSYPAPPGAPPDVPGLEFAGEVETCGERVRELQVGDRVMSILGGGGYADKVCLHERLCLRVPERLDWKDAAAVPEAFLTAYDALVRVGKMGPGETVLIQAAGSGVGTAAIQLVAAGGGRAIGLSRSPEKRRRLAELGPHSVLDPASDSLAGAILRATGGPGVDLVLDLVGAPAWPLYFDVLRERGRLVLVGLLGGSRAEIDLASLMRKRLILAGTVLRPRPLEEKIALVQEFSRRILPWLAAGRVRPVVDRTLPLEQAGEAHALLERNETFGKVVLVVGRT